MFARRDTHGIGKRQMRRPRAPHPAGQLEMLPSRGRPPAKNAPRRHEDSQMAHRFLVARRGPLTRPLVSDRMNTKGFHRAGQTRRTTMPGCGRAARGDAARFHQLDASQHTLAVHTRYTEFNVLLLKWDYLFFFFSVVVAAAAVDEHLNFNARSR